MVAPQQWDIVGGELRVAGDDGQSLGSGLADHEPVEWVAVMSGQGDQLAVVGQAWGKQSESVGIQHFGEDCGEVHLEF